MATLLGQTGQQENVYTVELVSASGVTARILTLGAIINELNIPTHKYGQINAVLGYYNWRSYLKDTAWHGAFAGRYCNRIANSEIHIGGKRHQLVPNEGHNHLHGGPQGFHRKVWQIEEADRQNLTLSLHSPHGDQGYPGNLDILLRYCLDDSGALTLHWQAHSDQDTVVSLTNHAYFNLAGHGDIRAHYLRIPAAEYTPQDLAGIPTGQIADVDGTILDLRHFKLIEQVLDSKDPLIEPFGGLDHNWARGEAGKLLLSGELLCPETDKLLQVSSTLPGLQCYSGNHLAANGIHGCHEGICLESQYYPNSPNEPLFPSPVLRAGDTMQHQTCFSITDVDSAGILADN